MATSAAAPAWNRPTTSPRSAGLRLSNVLPETDGIQSPAMNSRNSGGWEPSPPAALDVAEVVVVVGVDVADPVACSIVSVTAASSDSLERHRARPAATEAQRRHPVPPVAPAQLVQQRRDDPGARRPDRMPKRDRAAVDIHLRPVEAELTAVGARLRRERLVDLDKVVRLDGDLGLRDELLHALDRREKEPLQRDLGLRVADDPRQGMQTVKLDCALAGDDRRRRAIGDPR